MQTNNIVESSPHSQLHPLDSILIVVGIVIPLVLQLGTSRFFGSAGDVHATLCVYFIALGLTLLTTEVLKIYVGYLRPIFYALCEPSQDYSECMANGDSGRKSFPSGHASTSFCGLSLLTFYIHKRFGVPSQPTVIAQAPDGRFIVQYKNGMPHKARLVSVLSLAPIALAAFVAASRVVDNKHFPADVVGGAVLGTVLSVFAHSLWYVQVMSRGCSDCISTIIAHVGSIHPTLGFRRGQCSYC